MNPGLHLTLSQIGTHSPSMHLEVAMHITLSHLSTHFPSALHFNPDGH